jgi:glyoxylate reductase
MKVVYTANSAKPEFEKATGATYLPLDDLLRTADFISLHVPLTPKTKYLIGEREFGIMKKTAILVNTARGPVVDEKALAKALQTGQIWGAGLDVYEREPIVEDALLGLHNAVLVPHLEARHSKPAKTWGLLAADNI